MKNKLYLIAAIGLLSSCSDDTLEEISTIETQQPAFCQSSTSNDGLKAWSALGANGPFTNRRTLYYRFIGNNNSTFAAAKQKTFILQTYKIMDEVNVNFVNATGTDIPCQFSVDLGKMNNNGNISVVSKIGKENEVEEKKIVEKGEKNEKATVTIYNLPNLCQDIKGRRAAWEQPMLHALGHVLGLQDETKNPNKTNNHSGVNVTTEYDPTSMMMADLTYQTDNNGNYKIPMPSELDYDLLESLYPLADTCVIWNLFENSKNTYTNTLADKKNTLSINTMVGPLFRCLTRPATRASMLCSYYEEATGNYILSFKKTSTRQKKGYSQEKSLGYAWGLSYRPAGTVMLFLYRSSTSNKQIYSTKSQQSIDFKGENYRIAGPIAYVFSN